MLAIAMLLIPALALGASAWLVRTETGAAVLTPAPRQVVQSFVAQLGAHRPDRARARLTDDARAATTADQLKAMGEAFSERYGHYRFEGGQEQGDGEGREYRARIGTAKGGVVERTFRLARNVDTRLWEIAAFEPLDATPNR